jgi:patatin-like phospholipase/acyl hydrolase
MTAGTSTGSIIAAGLSCPSKSNHEIPAYFADDLLKIYVEKKDQIF